MVKENNNIRDNNHDGDGILYVVDIDMLILVLKIYRVRGTKLIFWCLSAVQTLLTTGVTDRQTDRQTDRHTDRQTDRHTDRQTDRQT